MMRIDSHDCSESPWPWREAPIMIPPRGWVQNSSVQLSPSALDQAPASHVGNHAALSCGARAPGMASNKAAAAILSIGEPLLWGLQTATAAPARQYSSI